MIMMYIPCKNNLEANKIAKHLVNKRFIACANIFPIKSVYRWKEKIVNDKETVLICKTLKRRFKAVENEIKKIHSYETPFIGVLDVKANKDYEKWVRGEII